MAELNENPSKEHFLYSVLNPKSMAVFGANNHLFNTMGSMQLRSIIKGEFNGKIYPIHLKLDTVQGMKAYKSVLNLPETPDLAFIIYPRKIATLPHLTIVIRNGPTLPFR